MEKEKIERINRLRQLQRERELTDEEKEEQNRLRREFIDDIKSQVAQKLDDVIIIDENGNKKKLTLKEQVKTRRRQNDYDGGAKV